MRAVLLRCAMHIAHSSMNLATAVLGTWLKSSCTCMGYEEMEGGSLEIWNQSEVLIVATVLPGC